MLQPGDVIPMSDQSFCFNTDPSVCSSEIHFNLEDHNIIRNVVFYGGCHGNLQAIAKLVEGRTAEEVIRLLKGNRCGNKTTSCGDQFARALEAALKSGNSKQEK